MGRNAYEIELYGKTVVLQELGALDLKKAMQAAGTHKNKDAQQFEQSMEGLRMSIVRVDESDVSYSELVGENLDKHFSMKELIALGNCWSKIHLPDDEEMESIVGGIKPVAGGI